MTDKNLSNQGGQDNPNSADNHNSPKPPTIDPILPDQSAPGQPSKEPDIKPPAQNHPPQSTDQTIKSASDSPKPLSANPIFQNPNEPDQPPASEASRNSSPTPAPSQPQSDQLDQTIKSQDQSPKPDEVISPLAQDYKDQPLDTPITQPPTMLSDEDETDQTPGFWGQPAGVGDNKSGQPASESEPPATASLTQPQPASEAAPLPKTPDKPTPSSSPSSETPETVSKDTGSDDMSGADSTETQPDQSGATAEAKPNTAGRTLETFSPSQPPPEDNDPNSGGDKDKDPDQPDQKPAVTDMPKKPLPLLRIVSLVLAVVVVIGGVLFLISKIKGRSESPTPSPSQETNEPQPKSEITLTYWGLWEPKEVMKPIFDKFTQETGIKVNYTQMEPRNYRLQLESAIKDGTGPDIFRFHNTWVPMLKEELADLPPDIFSPEEFAQTFYPVIVNDLTWEGKIKGVPLEIDGLVLFYNKDILSKAGLLESLPTNWDEFARLARQLTVYTPEGQIKTAGAALGTTNNVDHWSDIVGLMLYQNGVEMNNIAGSFDSKGRNLAADVLRYYTHFTTLSTPVWNRDLPPSTVMFADGRLAFYFGPSWRAFEFARLGINFGITSVPKIPGDTSEWATYWVEGVSRASKHKAQAWQLLKFMASTENLQLFFNQAQSQRLFGEPYPRRDLKEALLTNPYLSPIGNAAENYKSWYLASFTHDQGINDRIIDFLGKAINQVLEQKRPEQAISAAADEIYQILGSWGVNQ